MQSPSHDVSYIKKMSNNELLHKPQTPRKPTIRLAVVEDDAVLASELKAGLTGMGYRVDVFSEGRLFMQALKSKMFDMCLLDWCLPDTDGPALLAWVTQHYRRMAVLFLSGMDSPQQISAMLLAGADDYVVKPLNLKLLDGRLQAVWRRRDPSVVMPDEEWVGHIYINYTQQYISIDGRMLHLPPKEKILAFLLIRRRGALLTRSMLNEALGNPTLGTDTRRLDVYVSHLRHKLKLTREQGWRLTSVYQQGYRLEHLEEGQEDA